MHSSLNCELHAMMGARPFCTILRKWLKWKQLSNINNKERSSSDFFFNITNMLVEHGTTHTQGPFWEQWLCCHRVSEVSDRIVHAEHLQPVRFEHLQVWSHTHKNTPLIALTTSVNHQKCSLSESRNTCSAVRYWREHGNLETSAKFFSWEPWKCPVLLGTIHNESRSKDLCIATTLLLPKPWKSEPHSFPSTAALAVSNTPVLRLLSTAMCSKIFGLMSMHTTSQCLLNSLVFCRCVAKRSWHPNEKK